MRLASAARSTRARRAGDAWMESGRGAAASCVNSNRALSTAASLDRLVHFDARPFPRGDGRVQLGLRLLELPAKRGRTLGPLRRRVESRVVERRRQLIDDLLQLRDL